MKVSKTFLFRYTFSLIKIIINFWPNKKQNKTLISHLYECVLSLFWSAHVYETYPLVQLMRGGLRDWKKVSDGCNKDLKKQEINITFYNHNQT